MAPIIEELAGEGYRISYHDSDEEHAAATSWEIKTLPTVSVIRDGEEIGRVVGAMKKAALVAFLERNGVKPPKRRKTMAWDAGQYL